MAFVIWCLTYPVCCESWHSCLAVVSYRRDSTRSLALWYPGPLVGIAWSPSAEMKNTCTFRSLPGITEVPRMYGFLKNIVFSAHPSKEASGPWCYLQRYMYKYAEDCYLLHVRDLFSVIQHRTGKPSEQGSLPESVAFHGGFWLGRERGRWGEDAPLCLAMGAGVSFSSPRATQGQSCVHAGSLGITVIS